MHSAKIVPLLLDWFASNARALPWRRTTDPYAIWVSEIMLQQTQVKTVMPYWLRWMKALPTLQALATASPQKIHKLWEGLGYYTRVRNLQRAAQLILKKHGGNFPERFEDVLELPGIGRYTAGAICSIAFNQPKPILDGNVVRVLTRVYGIDGNARDKHVNASLWQLSEELVKHAALSATPNASDSPSALVSSSKIKIRNPKFKNPPAASNFNQALMELGALVCTPQQPKCQASTGAAQPSGCGGVPRGSACPLSRLCVAFQQGRINQLPHRTRRPRPTNRRFVALVAQKGQRFLVRQRPSGVLNAHLWEFPNFEVVNGAVNLNRAARQELGAEPGRLVLFFSLKHSITRYRIRLDVFHVNAARLASKSGNYRWAARSALLCLPFTSAHRKIIGQLTGKNGSYLAYRHAVPAEVDKALRRKARREGKSLNRAVLEILSTGRVCGRTGA